MARSAISNRLLSTLASNDFSLLEPHLSFVDLPLRKQLEHSNKVIESVYFLDSGIASVVANGRGGRSVEVGLIGREGMTGLAVVMGADRTPTSTYMQLAGVGSKIAAADLRSAMARSETLRLSFLRHSHAFIVQMSYTALANGQNKVEERLARWLLMAHDRVDGDDLALTQEFMSVMLGVRRPGVTVALKELTKRALVRVWRGGVTILDRAGPEKTARGAYGVPEMEFKRVWETARSEPRRGDDGSEPEPRA